jgi:hypothetical protein
VHVFCVSIVCVCVHVFCVCACFVCVHILRVLSVYIVFVCMCFCVCVCVCVLCILCFCLCVCVLSAVRLHCNGTLVPDLIICCKIKDLSISLSENNLHVVPAKIGRDSLSVVTVLCMIQSHCIIVCVCFSFLKCACLFFFLFLFSVQEEQNCWNLLLCFFK